MQKLDFSPDGNIHTLSDGWKEYREGSINISEMEARGEDTITLVDLGDAVYYMFGMQEAAIPDAKYTYLIIANGEAIPMRTPNTGRGGSQWNNFTRYHGPYLKQGKPIYDPVPRDLNGFDSGEFPKFLRQVDDKVFGSSLILPHHIPKLQYQHKIEHIISLVHGDWLSEFYDDEELGVFLHQFPHLGRYISPETVRDIVDLIDNLKGNVIVHCLKGRIRTGKILAAHEMINMGKTRGKALTNYLKAGGGNINNTIETFITGFRI